MDGGIHGSISTSHSLALLKEDGRAECVQHKPELGGCHSVAYC